MTDDLLTILRKVSALLAATPHDPARAAGGRCNCIRCRTERLAARGWPASVVGDGSGVRSTTSSSSVERAATTVSQFAGLDEQLTATMAELRAKVVAVLAIAAIVDSHGSDDDVVPPGTGECGCGCGKSCDPRRRGPEDRLKSGLHPTCHRRWLRWRATYPGVTISDFLDACYRERGETRARPVAPPADRRAS